MRNFTPKTGFTFQLPLVLRDFTERPRLGNNVLDEKIGILRVVTRWAPTSPKRALKGTRETEWREGIRNASGKNEPQKVQ